MPKFQSQEELRAWIIKVIREREALCYGHYNPRRHACLMHYHEPVCISCRYNTPVEEVRV